MDCGSQRLYSHNETMFFLKCSRDRVIMGNGQLHLCSCFSTRIFPGISDLLRVTDIIWETIPAAGLCSILAEIQEKKRIRK